MNVAEPSSPRVTVERIALGVVAAYLVRGARSILIDTGLPGQQDRLLTALDGVEPAVDLSAIIVTHLHADHAGNARGLADRLGVPVLTSAGGVPHASAGVNAPGTPTTLMATLAGTLGLVPNRFAPFQPHAVLMDGERLDAHGVPATVVATPGHTNHCISIVSDDGHAILSDVVRGVPLRRGAPGVPFLLRDADVWRASLDRITRLSWSTGFVGHGGPVRRSAFDAFVRSQLR